MSKKKTAETYSFAESLAMLSKLQKMAIDEGNINLALKAEELKCKIASLQAQKENNSETEDLTSILVDFINEEQNGKDTGDIFSASEEQKKV
ncbi:MAG: hypothetical protein J6039_04635 [Alphaproteobacteria bacterium]|nr:hypothetical protein [Alphaproteobacteria bacterium]